MRPSARTIFSLAAIVPWQLANPWAIANRLPGLNNLSSGAKTLSPCRGRLKGRKSLRPRGLCFLLPNGGAVRWIGSKIALTRTDAS